MLLLGLLLCIAIPCLLVIIYVLLIASSLRVHWISARGKDIISSGTPNYKVEEKRPKKNQHY
jgi:hypothetical protein